MKFKNIKIQFSKYMSLYKYGILIILSFLKESSENVENRGKTKCENKQILT